MIGELFAEMVCGIFVETNSEIIGEIIDEIIG